MNLNEQANMDNIQTQIDVNTLCTTLLARTEAVQIVVNIINAIIAARQSTGSPMSDEELNAIQSAINAENNQNMAIYNQIQATVHGGAPKEMASEPSNIEDAENPDALNTVTASSSAAMECLSREEIEKQRAE